MGRPDRLIPIEERLVSCCPDCPEFDGDYSYWSYRCNVAKQDIRTPVMKYQDKVISWKPTYGLRCPREGQTMADWRWAEKVVVHQYPECLQGRHPKFVGQTGTWGTGKGPVRLMVCKDCGAFENEVEARRTLGFDKG